MSHPPFGDPSSYQACSNCGAPHNPPINQNQPPFSHLNLSPGPPPLPGSNYPQPHQHPNPIQTSQDLTVTQPSQPSHPPTLGQPSFQPNLSSQGPPINPPIVGYPSYPIPADPRTYPLEISSSITGGHIRQEGEPTYVPRRDPRDEENPPHYYYAT
jgi:hypothetical protein